MKKKRIYGGVLNLTIWLVAQTVVFFGPMVWCLCYDGDFYDALLLGVAGLLLLWIAVILISLLRNSSEDSGNIPSDCSRWSVQWQSFKNWFWYEKWHQPWE